MSHAPRDRPAHLSDAMTTTPQSATVTVHGVVSGQPELRFTKLGRPVAAFGVSVTDHGRTSWLDVVAWNALAGDTAVALNRGDHVIVYGHLVQRVWETQTGDKRSKVEIVAEQIGVTLQAHLDSAARREVMHDA